MTRHLVWCQNLYLTEFVLEKREWFSYFDLYACVIDALPGKESLIFCKLQDSLFGKELMTHA